MDDKVKIIIHDTGEKKHLERCINSVCLQTDDNYEIDVVSSKEDFNGVLKDFLLKETKTVNEYIFFCDSESILSPDLFEDMKKTLKHFSVAAANILFYNGFEYIEDDICRDVIYSKMFETKYFTKLLGMVEHLEKIEKIETIFSNINIKYQQAESATVYAGNPLNYGKKIKLYEPNDLNPQQTLNDTDLQTTVIGYYSGGKLGIKSILKSLFAWIKYKANGKRRNSY